MKNKFILSIFCGAALHCGEAIEPSSAESVDAIIDESIASVPMVIRHGMSNEIYQAEFDAWYAQGFRITDLSAHSLDGVPRFSAIWEKKSGPAWLGRHGLTSAQYQAEYDYWYTQGFRPVIVEGYESGGVALYAAIFEQWDGTPFVARHGLTSAQYQAEFDYWYGQGFRLERVEGYAVGNTALYAALWKKASGPAFAARHGMTESQFADEKFSFFTQGFRLAHMSAYRVGGTVYYAAIWEKKVGATMFSVQGMTWASFQQKIIDRMMMGYRLRRIDGYSLGSIDYYSAVWVAEASAVDGDYCQGSVCFDLTRFSDKIKSKLAGKTVKYGFEIRRGISTIQYTEGKARTAADAPSNNLYIHDRFNPASVTKAVTAVATLQLLTKHGVSLDTPVHTYLPPWWNIPPNNRTITFAELLNHSSGLREVNMGGDLLYGNIKTLMEHEIAMIDKTPEYDNSNYAVLRLLVASLDGYTAWLNHAGSAARFISYVNANIFAPLGIYDVTFAPEANTPVLFYPNPPGNAHGTSYGDWSLKPGSAGIHLSIHEMAMFGEATFKGFLLSPGALHDLKTRSLGFSNYGTLPDGSTCYGKNGWFPASGNGGAEINTTLVFCENGLSGMLMLNAQISSDGVFMDAAREAFLPLTGVDSDPILPGIEG